jgi:hypothetical protein
MYRSLIVATIVSMTMISAARAQTDLSAYADANGFLNVQKLTCAIAVVFKDMRAKLGIEMKP